MSTSLLWVLKEAHPKIPMVLDYGVDSRPRYDTSHPHPQLDAIVVGIPRATPYLPREQPNPLLAAFLELVHADVDIHLVVAQEKPAAGQAWASP